MRPKHPNKKFLPILLLFAIIYSVFVGAGLRPAHLKNNVALAQDPSDPIPPPPTRYNLTDDEIATLEARSNETRALNAATPRLDTSLSLLVDAYQTGAEERGTVGATTAIRETAARFNLKTKNNSAVLVMVVATDAPSADQIKLQLVGMGGEVVGHFDRWLDLYIPVENLARLSQLSGVVTVQPPIPVYPVDDEPTTASADDFTLIGNNLTQGYNASGMGAWQLLGQYGQGVRIGILDSFQNYQTAIALGELPSTLQIYGSIDTDSPHGTAVAEIIYDMAPGAQLVLNTPVEYTATVMAQSVLGMAQSGHRIISSSIGPIFAGPGDGSDPLSVAIAQARANYNTLYFQAGGNQATKHWDGVFNNGGDDDYHNFSGVSEVNDMGYTQAGQFITIYMRWNAWPTTNQDYDLHLFRWTGTTWVAVTSSLGEQSNTNPNPPDEAIEITAPFSAYYGFTIEQYNATSNHILAAQSYRQNFFYSVPDRSLIDPASGTSTIGVAAVNTSAPYTIESYSSRGPTYGPGGNFGTGNLQPRISGYANVNTYAYGANGFNGTSAATPHIAGAAAVILGAYPYYTATNVQNFLEGRAVDLGVAGWDTLHGFGRLSMGSPPNWDTLIMFGYTTNTGSRLLTLQDIPATNQYYTWATGAPATGQWVMGDWNGDGWKTPGVYASSGIFYFTNEGGPTANWTAMWFGLFNRPPVAGRFGAANQDCIGVIDNANFPPYGTAFAMYYTCNMVGGNPAKSFQWLSVLLPDSGGHTGAHQFAAGDWNYDGRDTIAVRRGTYITYTNTQVTAPAEFPFAQFWGTPSASGYGRFVAGDWNGDGRHSFGVVYDDGYFYRRDDVEWNTGVYKLQRVGISAGSPFSATSWNPYGLSATTGIESGVGAGLRPDQLGTIIESDDPRVTRTGDWALVELVAASGGKILTADQPETALTLEFDGPTIEILYADGDAPAVFTIWIDDVAVRTVITNGEGIGGQLARIDYLAEGSHTLRIEAVQGAVAIDAFVVNRPLE